MQMIGSLAVRIRFLAAAIALVMLTCGTRSKAWCASQNLWFSSYSSGVESYTTGQLKKSGMPTPIQLSTFSDASGLAFDKSHNLWVVVYDGGSEVVQFTPAQLKNLKNDPSPTPAVVIRSTSTFSDIIGCNFDPQGNLWVVDYSNDSIDELSKAQLAAGSGNVTPAVVITSSDLDEPNFVTFDKAGNGWVDSYRNSKIAEFSSSQLMGSGSKSATVLLSDDGSGTSLDLPGEIAFDDKDNLWFGNFAAATVVEYAKDQLTSSGNPAPTVKLSSTIFLTEAPFAAVFDSKGNLVIKNYYNGTIAKFTPKQLKVSGAPVPKVSVTGAEIYTSQIIFGAAN